MGPKRRILVTGVSRWWGAATARQLLKDPSVAEVIGIDTETPRDDLGDAEFLKLDIRHSLIGKLVRSVGIDTVVHTMTAIDSVQVDGRLAHEINVIGTLNLLAGCSGNDTPVRRLVLKSSSHVYGARHNLPAYLREDRRLDERSRHPFVRDVIEVESTAQEFNLRNPETEVLILRFAQSLHPYEPAPFARYLDLPMVPTVLGLDPIIQLIHFEDCAWTLARAALRGEPGVYNVAAPGPLPLSQLLQRAGKMSAPMLPPIGIAAAGRLLRSFGLSPLSPQLLDLICWGRTLSTAKAAQALDFRPRLDTLAAYREFVHERRLAPFQPESSYKYDKELEDFIHSRRTSPRTAADPESKPPRPPRQRSGRSAR